MSFKKLIGSRHRRSATLYKVSSRPKRPPPPPVAYAKTHNGEKVAGVGKTLGEMFFTTPFLLSLILKPEKYTHTYALFTLEPNITKFPSDTTVTEGEGVYFRIKVSGVPQPTVTWYHDGEPIRADLSLIHI